MVSLPGKGRMGEVYRARNTKVSRKGAGTIWNVGRFDDTVELEVLVQNLFPATGMPYRVIESLMQSGTNLLDAELKANPSLEIEDLIKQEKAAASYDGK